MKARVALLLALWPGVAEAHSFSTGAGPYDAFVEGAGVILSSPGLLLPLIAVALMLSLWHPDGLRLAMPKFLIAQMIGMFVAPWVGPSVALWALGVGVVVAALAAVLNTNRLGEANALLAALVGGGVMAAALEGHSVGDVDLPIRLGLLLAVNLSVAVVAGLVRVVMERWPNDMVRIGWRITASWCAAILVLYLAFALTGAQV